MAARFHLPTGAREIRELRGSAHAFAEQLLNQQNKAIGIERLEPEDNIQPFVFGFRARQAAQHDNRKSETSAPHFGDKLRPAHDRHQVVGDDQANGLRGIRLLEEFECLLTLQCNADVPAAPFQDSPAGGRLKVVVIYQ